jgi:hypothetical protein
LSQLTCTGTSEFAITRFTTSGRLDRTFGNGGVVTTVFPNAPDGAAADAVLVQANGDILVGGEAPVPQPALHLYRGAVRRP